MPPWYLQRPLASAGLVQGFWVLLALAPHMLR